MTARNYIDVYETYDRFAEGKKVSEKEWDYTIIPRNAQMMKERYEIDFGRTILPTDQDLVDRLFIAGVAWGWRERLMWMLLSWFACDVTLHLVMGFAINEVYIMTAGWAFIIPLSIGFMARGLRPRPLSWLRLLVGALTAYLWLYNGGQLVYYLLTL